MILFYSILFLASFFLLHFSCETLVGEIINISKFFEVREFIVTFFIMSFISSLPNLSLGIFSALQGIPELSLGDVVGGNIVDLTLVLSLAVLFSKQEFSTKSRVVQTSILATFFITVLPILFLLDGDLSRIEGFILVLAFIFYCHWLSSKREKFKKIYKYESETSKIPPIFRSLGMVFLSFLLVIFATNGIILAMKFFGNYFKVSLFLIGMLIIGLTNCLPELYFSLLAARKGETWMVMGNLIGSVIFPSSLILGTVVLIHPIEGLNFFSVLEPRIFLFIVAFLFLLFGWTDKKIGKLEGGFLLLFYFCFVVSQLLHLF